MTTTSKPLPSRTYLRECFDYDLMSGEATWKERPIDHFDSYSIGARWNSRLAFTPMGRINTRGYQTCKIKNIDYQLHRLIWVWWYGTEPLTIDHIDRNKTNNRIVNLRSVTTSQNLQNRTISKNNTSGYKGVFVAEHMWKATTYYKGERIHLGTHNTPEEAAAAIKEFHE